MFKRLAIIAVLGVLIYSCNQPTQKAEETQVTMISEMVTEPLSYEGQEVTFEGTITHICRHSGDKMRVNQMNDSDFSILVMLEDFQTQINPDFEGRNVKVTGILKTEVRNLDEMEHDHDHAHDGEEGHECESTEEAIKMLEEKGITPEIMAYIEMNGFEVIEEASAEEVEATEETKETEETKDETVEVAEAAKTGEGC
ncbi:MAG: DUF4920 domain-containing protein [Bacteroidales bacterium]